MKYTLYCDHCLERIDLPDDEFGRDAVTDWFAQIHVGHLEPGQNIQVLVQETDVVRGRRLTVS